MRIQVVGGPQSGREIRIQQEISRVGSHPSVDFQIDGTAPHALTIQKCGKTIAVIPRADGLTIQGHPLCLGQAVAWKPDQVMQVGPEIRLRLLSVEDGPPQVEPSAWNHSRQVESDLDVASDAVMREAAQQTNSTLKLVLCGVCLTISGLMVLDLAIGGAIDPVVRSDFESIITAIQLMPDSSERTYLREVLQEGYFYRSRGNNQRAAEQFSDLRDRYLAMRKVAGFQSSQVEQSIYHFVKTQLTELKSKADIEILQ